MIELLLRLYPASWRRRYGDEFAAVLESRPLGPFDAADVLLGALDAHLHRRGLWTEPNHGRNLAMTLRIGGLAAIAFGLFWALGIAWASLNENDDDLLPISLTMLADVGLILAVVGLSAFQARRHAVLVWVSVLLPAAGAAVGLAGVLGMRVVGDGNPFIAGLSPYYVWLIGALGILAGSVLFAIATWRTRALAPRAAALMGVGAAWSLLAGFLSQGLLVVGLVAFSTGWIWLGMDALRRDRAAAAALA